MGLLEAEKAAPRLLQLYRLLEKTQGQRGRQAHAPAVGGPIRNAAEQVRPVPGGFIQLHRGIAFLLVRERLGAVYRVCVVRQLIRECFAHELAVLGAGSAAVHLPAEALQLFGTLDVPLAEVPGAIARLLQSLGEVGLVFAQHVQVRDLWIEHLQHAVIVRQQPGHDAGSCRTADVVGCVGARKAHALRRQPVEMRRGADVIRIQHARLHLVRHQKEYVGCHGGSGAPASRCSDPSAATNGQRFSHSAYPNRAPSPDRVPAARARIPPNRSESVPSVRKRLRRPEARGTGSS